jgi:voltage-gated potassium channel
MLSFALTFIRLARALGRSMQDPEFRALLLLFGVLLFSGTMFYSNVEGWSLLDSLYFSVATLSTVGYGDFAPRTDFGKIFTIIYLLVGVGVFAALVGKLALSIGRRSEAPPSSNQDTAQHRN